MSALEVAGIVKRFGGESVLDDVGFHLESHRILAVLGRSGSGKTTLLRIVAGLEAAEAGSIRLDGREIGALPPQRRGILYLSQDPLLLPHLDVAGNLAFGLELRRVPAAERRRRVAEMVAALGLEDHARKRPQQLSGGQRQRVAFGRALIVNPPVLLLDEPFGALDADTRGAMQALFLAVAQQFRITAVFVTHDLKEAIRTGDVWAHLRGGRLHRFETLAELVADPSLGAGDEIDFWSSLAACATGANGPGA